MAERLPRSGYTLRAALLPQDAPHIAGRRDPRFCAACPPGTTRIETVGHTFCEPCRTARLAQAKRLWAREYHQQLRRRRQQEGS
jgi:hypothetical protein